MNDSSTASSSGSRVVVGVDGSPDSIAALRAGEWAAAARGGTLVAVVAYGVPMVVPRAPTVLPDMRGAAVSILTEALADAFHGRSVAPIETVVRAGRPAAVLVEASRDADLLVVGSRGHGGFFGMLIGSVSMACSMHAVCPVLVMHPDDGYPVTRTGGQRARVVVGVGGSPASSSVLQDAALAASEMGAELVAIATWEDLSLAVEGYLAIRSEITENTTRSLDAAVTDAFAGVLPPHFRSEVREGSAAGVLVDESRRADLVVVGRTGRSEFASVLMGSVSLPVAEHASCPVLVVPATRPAVHRVPDVALALVRG